MKNKIITKTMCFAAIASLGLSACGSSQVVQDVAPPEEVAQVETPAEPEKEVEMMQTYKLEIGETAYDDLEQVGDGYYVYYSADSDLWGVLDAEGNEIIEPTYSWSNYDEATDCIILTEDTEAGYLSEIYDSKMNFIWSNEKYQQYYISEYNAPVVHLVDPATNSHQYFDLENDEKFIANINADNNDGFDYGFGYRQGFIMLNIKALYEDGFVVGIDKDGNTVENFKVDDRYINPLSALSTDGWMYGAAVTLERSTPLAGFYNYLSGEFVEKPESVENFAAFPVEGMNYCTSVNGYAFIAETLEDGETTTYQPLNIKESKISDVVYKSISFDDRDLILVQTLDDKWGYVDNDYNLVSELYDDACSFANGKAVVKKDGKIRIINSDFEDITDPEWNVEDIDSVSSNLFGACVVDRGEKMYIAKIVEGAEVPVE